jgi:hypothetical protein
MRILLLVLIFIGFFLPSYASEYTNPDGSLTAISIPEWLSEPVSKTLNKEVQERLPTFDASEKQLAVQAMRATAVDTEPSIDTSNWEHTITVKKIFSDEKITSLVIHTYEYTGGAHGSSSRIGLVIDNATGKKLSLSDLYDTKKLTMRLSPIWQKQIISNLKRNIEKLTTDDRKWIREGTVDIQNYQSFVLTPKMLIVYGQEYQHNAYAYGTQTLMVQRNKLNDIAK